MNHDSNVFLMQMITAERKPLQHCKTCALAHAPHGTEQKQMYEEIGEKNYFTQQPENASRSQATKNLLCTPSRWVVSLNAL